MATQSEGEEAKQISNPQGLKEMVVEQYKKIKDNAETYPYVWGSYMVVYGGFGLWTAYRWRKLRKTEDRVRALQARLKELVDSQQAPTSTAPKVPPSIDKSQPSK